MELTAVSTPLLSHPSPLSIFSFHSPAPLLLLSHTSLPLSFFQPTSLLLCGFLVSLSLSFFFFYLISIPLSPHCWVPQHKGPSVSRSVHVCICNRPVISWCKAKDGSTDLFISCHPFVMKRWRQPFCIRPRTGAQAHKRTAVTLIYAQSLSTPLTQTFAMSPSDNKTKKLFKVTVMTTCLSVFLPTLPLFCIFCHPSLLFFLSLSSFAFTDRQVMWKYICTMSTFSFFFCVYVWVCAAFWCQPARPLRHVHHSGLQRLPEKCLR